MRLTALHGLHGGGPHWHVGVNCLQQFVVGNDDQCVDVLPQLLNGVDGLQGANATLSMVHAHALRRHPCYSGILCTGRLRWQHTCWRRRRPSNEKGVVTIPTVRMPMPLAMPATTGAAPLPVPPPMPACKKGPASIQWAHVSRRAAHTWATTPGPAQLTVTKTMSDPLIARSRRALLSSAAFCSAWDRA